MPRRVVSTSGNSGMSFRLNGLALRRARHIAQGNSAYPLADLHITTLADGRHATEAQRLAVQIQRGLRRRKANLGRIVAIDGLPVLYRRGSYADQLAQA